jgi:hypothetical protein
MKQKVWYTVFCACATHVLVLYSPRLKWIQSKLEQRRAVLYYANSRAASLTLLALRDESAPLRRLFA